MALSRSEAYPGISSPTREKTRPAFSSKPLSLTPSEIDKITSIVPPELTPENPVTTPVGVWRMEDRPTFYSVSPQKLAEITIPERRDSIINKVKTIAKVVFQMG